MKICDKLKQLREEKGFSVYKLSKLSEVSSTYIHEIEQDKKQPTVEILSRICNALGVTLSQFFQENEQNDDLPTHLQELLEVAKKLSVEDTKNLAKIISKVGSD